MWEGGGRGSGVSSGHVQEKKDIVLVGKLEGDGEVLGRTTHGWEDNIKIGLQNWGVNL
jgi:hypothetical protein